MHLLRDGLVEGVHYGSVVVVAPDGTVAFQAGDVDAAFYPRSAAKPIQATAMTGLGLRLPPELLALSAASHSGEEVHLVGAQHILDTAGLSERELRNPADLPYDPVERDAWIAAGRAPSRLAHNCSGKHSAMLATSARHGWSLTDYMDPAHPLQQAIAATVAELTGGPVAHVAVDGCGTPLFAVSLRGLATAIGRIASAPDNPVATAMRAHPEMVGGSRRDGTALARAVPGLLAKDGFEAVQVAALPDGTAIALKIADGGDRARPPVLAAALRLCGVSVPAGPENLRVAGKLAEAVTVGSH